MVEQAQGRGVAATGHLRQHAMLEEPLPRESVADLHKDLKNYREGKGIGTRPHQPPWSVAAFQGSQGTVHRYRVGFRGKPTENLSASHTHLVQRPKNRRDAPHNCPNSLAFTGPFAAQKVIGAAMGVRAQCGLLFWSCQGKSCDRATWAHSIMVVAAKDRRQAAASPLLDLAGFNEQVEHHHLWEKGKKLHFPLRLLACWCSNGSCLLLEADRCATYPFWALGTLLPVASGATTAAQLTLADLLETVACRSPSTRLGSVGDDISTQTAVTAKMVTVVTHNITRLVTQGPK